MSKIAALTVIPFLGWILAAIIALLAAIPLYFLWQWLAPTYLYFLPVVYQKIGYLDMAGLLILIGFLKLTLLPNFSSTTNVSK